MNLPQPGDYIDIHNHGGHSSAGVFQIENLLTNEERLPASEEGLTYTIGIHPWYLTSENLGPQLEIVRQYADNKDIIAIGEAGFDKLKGPGRELEQRAFEMQVEIAEKVSKPMVIHCVRSWDELLASHKKLNPVYPWLVHGFRGKPELAKQLISKGMYLSFWFSFILRPESAKLITSLPRERIFLETDGSGADIGSIYNKVATDLGISLHDLKALVFSNFKNLFNK